MNAPVERLAAEALALPTAGRADLAHRLIQSLDAETEAEAEAAGDAEALRRLGAIQRGEVEPISAEELFARVRTRLGK